jgi:uncharacterized membrane protein YqaE (UPF0057 family)
MLPCASTLAGINCRARSEIKASPPSICSRFATLSRKILYMRLLISLILPWLTFFTIGRPLAGIVCLVLQLTVIGWLPATIWAVYALSQYKTDQKIQRALQQRG